MEGRERTSSCSSASLCRNVAGFAWSSACLSVCVLSAFRHSHCGTSKNSDRSLCSPAISPALRVANTPWRRPVRGEHRTTAHAERL